MVPSSNFPVNTEMLQDVEPTLPLGNYFTYRLIKNY